MALISITPKKIKDINGVVYNQPDSVDLDARTISSVTGNALIIKQSVYRTWTINEVHTIIDMPSSTKITMTYYGINGNNRVWVDVRLYYNNNQIWSSSPDGNQANDNSYCGLIFDQTNNKIYFAYPAVGTTRPQSIDAIPLNMSTYPVSLLLNNSIPPEHTWAPVGFLSGNNGQFYLPMSQIKAENIGDGETYTSTEDASKVIITNQSRIYNMLINIPNNEETIFCYCGGNYATVTRQYVTGQQLNEITYIIKFYFRSGTLIYTTPQFSINDPPGTDYYFSMITDDTNQAAALDMILHLHALNKYGWNDQALPSAQDMYELWTWLQDNGQEHEQGTPYDTGSTDNGGEPNNPRPQDHITDSALPTTGGLNMGIITLYCPDDTELTAISSFLWSDDVLDNFKKYFNNFADNILCLYSLPFKPASLPTKVFTVGKVASQATALAAVEYCTTRYFDIDMGSVTLDSRWGSYLDYSPYTKIEIYLPYVGMHSLDIDEFMSPTKMDGTIPDTQGCIISLVYRLDIVTGLIVAKVKITSGGGVSNEIRYQFTGKVGSNIPLTGQTFSNLINGIVTAGAGLASTIATGGLTAPMSAAATVTATIQAQKPSVTSIGNISGDASMLATDVPYLRITSPNKPLLEDQQVFTGFPSYKAGTLTNFTGYTEVIDAHVEGISCTEEERAKILTYLKDGVII